VQDSTTSWISRLTHLRQLADVMAGLSAVVSRHGFCRITGELVKAYLACPFAVGSLLGQEVEWSFSRPSSVLSGGESAGGGRGPSTGAATFTYSVNSQNRATNRLEHMWTLRMNWSAVPHWSCAGPGSTGSP
jgi:hypothetical protein